MRCKESLSGQGLGFITSRVAYRFAVEQVREIGPRQGEEIEVRQDRRYIDADAISVDGKWYPVVLDPNEDGVRVTRVIPKVQRGWFDDGSAFMLDENGRWRNDATNE